MIAANDTEIRKFIDIIKGMKTGILVTHIGAELKGRPLQVVGMDEEGIIWFYTYEQGGHLKEMTKNNQVFLSFAEPETDVYAVVSARAFEEGSQEKMKTLQNPVAKSLLSKGASAKNLVVFRAEPIEAEFWDGESGRIVILFRMLRNLLIESEVTHESYQNVNK